MKTSIWNEPLIYLFLFFILLVIIGGSALIVTSEDRDEFCEERGYEGYKLDREYVICLDLDDEGRVVEETKYYYSKSKEVMVNG